MHIAVVEDERPLAEALKKGLESEGHTVQLCFDAASARYTLGRAGSEHDLIILDLMLPDDYGGKVCSDLRASGLLTPILVLTARESAEDKVDMLDRGADDFMSKPFNFDELLARARALARRSAPPPEQEIAVGELRLIPAKREVYQHGIPRILTAREFDILLHLVLNKGRIVRRAELLRRFWGSQESLASNVVDVHIRNLRKKLTTKHAAQPIQTVHGSGYLFES